VYNKKDEVYEEIVRYHTDVTLGLMADEKDERHQARQTIRESGKQMDE
jgi:hypothetical protein